MSAIVDNFIKSYQLFLNKPFNYKELEAKILDNNTFLEKIKDKLSASEYLSLKYINIVIEAKYSSFKNMNCVIGTEFSILRLYNEIYKIIDEN